MSDNDNEHVEHVPSLRTTKGNEKNRQKKDAVQMSVWIPESHKIDLKIRLHHDGLTQAKFLRAAIAAYLKEEAQFMTWFRDWKLQNSKIKNKQRHRKSDDIKRKGKDLASKFGINEGEIEDIFDIIEQEYPDL